MITKKCDNCERALEAPDDAGGRKVRCPDCGDVNVMPWPENRPPDRAEVAGYPPDRGPEQRVMFVRPAMFRARPLLFSALTCVAVAGLVGAIALYFAMDPGTPRNAAAIASILASLAALTWLAIWRILKLSVALEVTNKRTVARRGLLSKATTEVVHDNIRNVQVTQTFWQRLFNVGTIGISSSGQDGIEIEVNDVPRPTTITRVIDLYRPL
jgi:alkylated DNA nucleotide flippase Atl1/phage FluMu protein Com